MSYPIYHLRPNKAIDRLALVEAIRRLDKHDNLSEYTYYGFGGPFLEDFRLLYELYPNMEMVSIERNEETYRRQGFHLPCSKIRLENIQLGSFLANYEARDKKSIFWLDFTGLEYSGFEDFMTLLGKVAAGSMVKITLRSEPKDYIDKTDLFRRKFEAVLPDSSVVPPPGFRNYAFLLQQMTRVAAQTALPSAFPHTFQPVSSFCYSDGTGIFTLTGIVCQRGEENSIKKEFQRWQFANLNWSMPKRIDVPVLTTKERLHLQSYLPCEGNAGRVLREELGYLIDDGDKKTTESKLKQYAEFHRYAPYFMRAIP